MKRLLLHSGRRQDSSREPSRNSGEHAVDRKRSAIRFAKASMPSNPPPQGVATQGGIFGLGKIPQLFLSKKKDVSQSQEPSPAVSRAGIPLMTQAGPGPGVKGWGRLKNSRGGWRYGHLTSV